MARRRRKPAAGAGVQGRSPCLEAVGTVNTVKPRAGKHGRVHEAKIGPFRRASVGLVAGFAALQVGKQPVAMKGPDLVTQPPFSSSLAWFCFFGFCFVLSPCFVLGPLFFFFVIFSSYPVFLCFDFFFFSSLVFFSPKKARRGRDRAWPAAGVSPAGNLGVWGLAPTFSHSPTPKNVTFTDP